jgi:acetyl-CoA acetyltransferase
MLPPLALTVAAVKNAVADAGLTLDDIDGLSTYPGMGAGTPGFAGPSSPEVQDALRLRLNWHDGGGEGAGQMRAVIAACLAVAAGLARHVLVYRTVSESTAQGSGGRQGIGGGGGGGGVPRFSGFLQWSLPFGAVSAVNWIALVAQRRMHEFGLTREQLGQIALNGRRNAADNPSAIYRQPMDLADYLDARMISTPLCLFDCDAPCDGSTAFVVSHRDYAPDTPHPACHVNAVGTALRGRPSWDQFDDPTSMAARDAAASMWERTDLRPSDVDVAQLYDGFSILAMVWLEALGFCGRGESGPFVADGTAIGRAGVLPLNTAGGQLSGGRLHGFGLIHEACVQLRGQGGERQVYRRGTSVPEVAAVSNGGGPIAGTMLLTRGEG